MEQRASLSFGTLLKRYRRVARLTQEQLAEQAGYSVSYISMLERGERLPVRATVELLADALTLTASERSVLEASARERDAPAVIPRPPRFSRVALPLPPIVGRAAEMARIERHLTGEGPPLLLLSGEPGIGKSRLLSEARLFGTASGWATLAGSAVRGGTQQPYTPLLEAIERHVTEAAPEVLRVSLARAPWLARLLPELAEISPPPQTAWALPPEQERRLIFTAVASYLDAVSGATGAMLVLDDLQWAGADALDLLAFLVRSPVAPRLRVLGAYREAELQPGGPLATLLADMAAAGLITRLPLGPLSPDEATSVVREALPEDHLEDAAIEHIVSRGGGIPFYLLSFAQSLAGNAEGATSENASEVVPWEVAQTIRQRIAALSTDTQEILQVAALGGQGVQRNVLLAASHELSDEDSLAVSLDAACRARLLMEEGDDGYAFVHELAREVVVQDIGLARRASLHFRLAEALEGRGGEKPAEALAYHFMRAGRIERALPYLSQAANRARAMQAFTAAAAGYRELAEAQDQLLHSHEAAEAREQLGVALTVSGRYAEAIDALEASAKSFQELGEERDVLRVVAKIGLAYAASGDAVSGIQRLEPLASPDDSAPNSAPNSEGERAELLDALAQLYNVGGRYADQLSATMRAATLAQASDDAHLRAQVQMRYGSALRMLGRMDEATSVLEEAIHLSAALHDDQNLAFALENVSVVYLLQGKLHQTNDYVQRALALAQHLGDPIVLALMTLRRGMSAYVLGEWDAALMDYESAEAKMREVGVAWVSAYTLIGLGQIQVGRGESEKGARHLADAVERGGQSGDLQALRWAQTALAEQDLLEGRPEAARQRLEPLLDRPGLQEGLVTYLLPYLAWACELSGEAGLADAHIRACLERAESEQIHLALVDALRVQALIALNRGDVRSSDAERGLHRAMALCRSMPYPYAEAKSLYVLGLLCHAQGDLAVSSSHWDAASGILQRLGERPYANRIAAAGAENL